MHMLLMCRHTKQTMYAHVADCIGTPSIRCICTYKQSNCNFMAAFPYDTEKHGKVLNICRAQLSCIQHDRHVLASNHCSRSSCSKKQKAVLEYGVYVM